MIDDNSMEHMIVQRMLDAYGLFPGASHSLDAKLIIEFMEKHIDTPAKLPDVILLDLNMPDFSGWDFLTCFEMLYPFIKKPVDIYIVSSSTDVADRQRAAKYPFIKDYFYKPVLRQTLIDSQNGYNPPRQMDS